MQKNERLVEQSSTPQDLKQLIVFKSGNEEFGIAIDDVREIIKASTVTPIPNSPAFVKGLISVRGEIVTVIDIKSRFSLLDKSETESKHIVVTKQDDNLFGIIVDEVIEVLRIKSIDINPPPSLIEEIKEDYVRGVVTYNGRLIIILDLNRVLSQAEMKGHIYEKNIDS